MTPEEAFAELAQLTGLSAGEWADFLSLPPAGQRIAVECYRAQDWTKSPATLERVLAVLQALGAVAGVVTGVAGAVAAVAALREP